MDKTEKNVKDYYVIDIGHVVKTVWHRIWIVAIVSVLTAAMGFALATFAIVPTYSSSVMLYVNNSSFSLGNTSFSISASEITAAQSLVKTYGEILNNRTTLERIISETEVNYTYKELSEMITYGPSNETEIMKVTVTSKSPYEASEIANCVAEILQVRISEIIDGASMEIVGSAKPVLEKVSPSISKFTVVGFLLGMLFTLIMLIISALMDNTVHDEEYVINTYDYPILAKVPDLLDSGSGKYGYSYYYKKKSDKGGK